MKKDTRRKIGLMLLLGLMNLCRNVNWLIPSSLLNIISLDLGISSAQCGQMLFIVTLFMGIFLLVGTFLIDRIGAMRAMQFGTACFAVDGLCSLCFRTYGLILAGRVFSGIGYGLTTCASVALISANFPERQRKSANSINACIGSLSIMASYALIVPLYSALGMWQAVSASSGAASLALAGLFVLWQHSGAANPVVRSQKPSLATAWRYPAIRVYALMYGVVMLIYICFNSYYPDYLYQVRGYPLAQASTMTGYLAVSGIAGSLLLAPLLLRFWSDRWSFLCLYGAASVSILGMTLFAGESLVVMSICGTGMCYNAMAVICTTKIMNLPGVTSSIASAGTAIMSSGSLLAVLVPGAYQFLAGHIGTQWAMTSFSGLLLPGSVGVLLTVRLAHTRTGP